MKIPQNIHRLYQETLVRKVFLDINKNMRRGMAGLFFLLVIVIAVFVCVRYYSYVFARTVKGEILNIDRVTQPTTIIGTGSGASGTQNLQTLSPSQLYSFAVAIRDFNSEIHTASSEDRQWAVAEKGQCAEAKFFPYPFWHFDKAGTYFGARLVKLFDCPGKKPAEAAPPVVPAPAAPAQPTPAAPAVNPTMMQ